MRVVMVIVVGLVLGGCSSTKERTAPERPVPVDMHGRTPWELE